MKRIKFNVDDVLPHLAQTARLVSTKTTMPILSNVLIESVADNTMMLTACDQESWLSMKVPVDSCEGDVNICVNAANFNSALSNLNGRVVVMDIDEEKRSVTCDYSIGQFSLPYDNGADFPRAEAMSSEGAETKIFSSKGLFSALDKVSFATSTDELRPALTGIHFEFTADGMVTAASDAHKLARYADMTMKAEEGEDVAGITVTKRSATILTSILLNTEGNVKMVFNTRTAVFNNTKFRLVTRLIEGKFPNFSSVIPRDNNIKTTVNTDDFSAALRRTAPMSNAASKLITLSFAEGYMTVAADDKDLQKSACESLTCDYNESPMTIGFNSNNLSAMLKSIGSDGCTICLKSPVSACVFKPSQEEEGTDFLVVVMPTRVQ